MRLKFLLLFLGIFLLPFCSSAHYIVGVVNNSLDGTNANDHIVVLWNSANGMNDNLTDIIGPNGNSGTNNFYMIDCEMLNTPCDIGDTLKVKVYDVENRYISNDVEVSVTGAGYDAVSNIIMNSPPNVSINFPINHANVSEAIFNCSFSDLDANLYRVDLYGNWSGGWHLNESVDVSGGSGSVLFNKNLEDGDYKWACNIQDNLSVSSFSNNFSLRIDSVSPLINSVTFNETHVCGTSDYVRITCNTTDVNGIQSVIVESISPSFVYTNNSAFYLGGDEYYADVLVDEVGNWNFSCISFDFANNSNKTGEDFSAHSTLADLFIESSEINFSNSNPFENEEILIGTTVYNNGCANANNFLVSFFEGDPDLGGVNIDNTTISVGNISNFFTNISWPAKIGKTNIFVSVDFEDAVTEFNESNNKGNKTFDVNIWQEFYGNVSFFKLLADYSLNDVTSWGNETEVSGNVFMTDMESDIDWLSLWAIGKKTDGSNSTNDFSEIDNFLGIGNFDDSVSVLFSDDEVPKKTADLFVHKEIIQDVPIINSSDAGGDSFFTGILWDSSDDSDGEYNSEKEDLVFIAQVNKSAQGEYGIYDYELKVPVSLRDYDSLNVENLYFYYDLI